MKPEDIRGELDKFRNGIPVEPGKKTAKKPSAPDKVLHLCFIDKDPDGMSSPINVRVSVTTNMPPESVGNVVNDALAELDIGDYDSDDEYVEAVMNGTGFKWGWDRVETDLFFEI